MTWRGWAALCGSDLRAAGRRSVLSVLGVAVGIWVLALIVALGGGVRRLVLREVVRELPLDMVEVVPQQLDLGLLQLDAGGWLGGAGGGLDQDVLLRLRALPQVATASGRLPLPLPMGARGGAHLFGRPIYTDVFVDALDPTLLPGSGAAAPGAGGCAGEVPVWISDQLIEIFNGQVAGAAGLPRIGAEALVGLRFELTVGRSMMLGGRSTGRQGQVTARIAGVSRWAMRLGLTTTLACGERIWADFGGGGPPPRFASVLVRAVGAHQVPELAEAVEGMGLAVDKTAAKTRRILAAATALAAGVGLLVLLMATLNIGHSFVAQLNERRRELGVLRALGAQQRHLLLLVLGQALVLGLAGGLVGLAAALGSAAALDAMVRVLVPHFPFRPESFFVFDLRLGLGCTLLAALASVAGALPPAWRAARRSIAVALADT